MLFRSQRLVAAVPALQPKVAGPAGGPLLQARGLCKQWRAQGPWWRRTRAVQALDSVNVSVREGETLAVVGESGSGKSTLARVLARLIDADAGDLEVQGVGADLLARRESQLQALRGRVQLVFQDPFAALNPRHPVGRSIAMGPMARGMPEAQAWSLAQRLMEQVKLDPRSVGQIGRAHV